MALQAEGGEFLVFTDNVQLKETMADVVFDTYKYVKNSSVFGVIAIHREQSKIRPKTF